MDRGGVVSVAAGRKIHACMLSYSFYESDNRVMRYAEALAQRGDEVDVIALREKGQPEFEVLRGVNVHRIQERVRDEKGKLAYLCRLGILPEIGRHPHPETLAECPTSSSMSIPCPISRSSPRLLAKLRGANLILDIHDIVPEFYAQQVRQQRAGPSASSRWWP